ncbi:jg21137, partial [Pararge aegeria aegeria]
MEKVLDRYIRDAFLIERPIHATQHAYCKGRSTETALLSLVDKVEKALEDKEIALSAFLDIEGAFDNTPIRTLVGGLVNKQADHTTIRWVEA